MPASPLQNCAQEIFQKSERQERETDMVVLHKYEPEKNLISQLKLRGCNECLLVNSTSVSYVGIQCLCAELQGGFSTAVSRGKIINSKNVCITDAPSDSVNLKLT